MNPTALTDACERVLTLAGDALNQVGAPGAPTRQFVSAGDPDPDCELLAVFGIPFPGRSAGGDVRQTNCVILHRARITVRYWTCLPGPEARKPADAVVLEANGATVHDALWAVWSRLGTEIVNGTLLEGLTCTKAELLDQSRLEQRDGSTGWTVTLELDLTPLLADPTS